MKTIIHTDQAPKALGPYSQAVKVNNFIFTSGQLGTNPQNGKLLDGIEGQTRQAFMNIQAILGKAGVNFKNIIKTVVFLSDINDFEQMNSIYKEFFEKDYPARSAIQVAKLPKDALVEIEVVACK